MRKANEDRVRTDLSRAENRGLPQYKCYHQINLFGAMLVTMRATSHNQYTIVLDCKDIKTMCPIKSKVVTVPHTFQNEQRLHPSPASSGGVL
jgi:hypothetical protein